MVYTSCTNGPQLLPIEYLHLFSMPHNFRRVSQNSFLKKWFFHPNTSEGTWKQDGNINQNNLPKGQFSNQIKSILWMPNSDPVTSFTGNTLRHTYKDTHHNLVSNDTWKPPKFPQTVYIPDRGIMEPINMMEKQTACCVEYIHAQC